MDTGPEASRATKFTYLPSCSANELVHRRLGVFCTVFTPVYWGAWSILRRDASRHKAWILGRRPRARQRITYLPSCSANELVHRRLGVFCPVFTSVYWGTWYILRREARRNKARILDQSASRATKNTYSLSCFATELVHRCLGVICRVLTLVY